MMNYSQTLEYLFTAMPSFQSVGGDAYKPGLERIESFCEVLGSPHKKYRVVHVAGTNGKGSTSHMMASVLQCAGHRVGLFTSPHLHDFRERMRVNGKTISEEEVVRFVERYREDMERIGLSFFEMTAAMAFDFFARMGVDIAVVETGLGGRLDATNIVAPELSVITNIGLEHTQYLGDTLAKIAGEKAGIIKRGGRAVLGERGEEYTEVFEQRATKLDAELCFAEDMFEVVESCDSVEGQSMRVRSCESGVVSEYMVTLGGDYQRRNVVTLLAALSQLKERVSQEAICEGLRRVVELTGLMGRWQVIGREPLTVCDTGHNGDGLELVTRQLRRQNYRKLYCVLGFARDKDLRRILPMFPAGSYFIFTRPNVERAFSAAEIADVAREMDLECEMVDGVREALARGRELAGREDMLFVGGSNFVVAEI